MTKEALAIKLDGREYGEEITKEEEHEAKKAGLVVLFGYSDDNAEFRGAIHDEVSCFEGTKLNVTKKGVIPGDGDHQCDCEFCGYAKAAKASVVIDARWCEEGYSWCYRTEIPHATFNVLEGDEKFCRGIVFAISDIKGEK
jgi:hypothetical protein